MKWFHKKRLEKLATHLEKGKLGHSKFNFGMFSFGNRKENGCGTLGCALGECPVLFPRDWSFVEWYADDITGEADFIVLACGEKYTDDSAVAFFGINHSIVHHLFYPTTQKPENYGGRRLSSKATRKQVAANIRAFLKKVAAGEVSDVAK